MSDASSFLSTQNYCPSEEKETGGHIDVTPTQMHVVNIQISLFNGSRGGEEGQKISKTVKKTVHPNQL